MQSDAVQAKAKEITQTLAEQTGVSVADVTKILNRLGLENALNNRQNMENHADRYGIDKAGIGLSDVKTAHARIAVSPSLFI